MPKKPPFVKGNSPTDERNMSKAEMKKAERGNAIQRRLAAMSKAKGNKNTKAEKTGGY